MIESIADAISFIKKTKRIKQSDVAKELGMSAAHLSSVANGKQPTTAKLIKNFYEKFGLSISKPGYIKFWREAEVAQGLFNEQVGDDTPKFIEMHIPDYADCSDAIEMMGDSMSPDIESGDIIIIKRWTESFYIYGHPYVIVTNQNNIIVRFVRKSKSADEIRGVAANNNYDDVSIRLADIKAMYLIKGQISRNSI